MASRPFALDVSRRLLQWATWIPVAVAFNTFVAELTFVKGGSMYPFFNEDKDSTLRRDLAVNWKLYPNVGLEKGMVITFTWVSPLLPFYLATPSAAAYGSTGHYATSPAEGRARLTCPRYRSPLNPEVSAVKRITALEGDRVYPRDPHQPVTRVPKGHIWVEGDAGSDRESLDSNTYGPISARLVTGRLTHIVYPWKKFGRIRWWEHPVGTGLAAQGRRYW